MKKWFAGGFCTLTMCLSARADDNADKFDRNMRQIQRDTQQRYDEQLPQSQRALIDYGGYLTLGYLSFDDSAHDNHALRQYELVGYGRVNFDGAHEFYARGRADYNNYNPGDSFERRPDRLAGRMEEGWYRFDLQRFAATQGRTVSTDVSIKAGRQFVDWGNGLTLDQYADGVLAQVRSNTIEIDALACVTVKETIDFDITRPEFDGNTHRGFYGAKIAFPIGHHKPYAYFLLQRDYNRDESTTAHIIPTRYHYDSYYAGAGSTGAFGDHLAYAAEFCYEGGHTLSNSFNEQSLDPVGQTSDRIDAYAADLRLDYLFNDSRKSRLSVEAVLASGDDDRLKTTGTFGGNRPHTVDHAFNGLGVIYDGLAFAPPVSNLLMLRLGASTYPARGVASLRNMQVGADFFVFGKADRDAPVDEPTKTGRYLGCEPDMFINWQITDDVTLAVRYGLFFPGDAIPSGSQDHVRQFLYAAVTYAF